MFRTLRRRILMGYSIALVLVVVVLAWALANLLTLGSASEAILQENYRSALAAENMIDALERQDSAVLLLILGHPQRGVEQYTQNESQFLQWLARAKDNVTIAGEGEIIAAIDQRYASYLGMFATVRDAYGRDPTEAAETYYEKVLPLFTSVRGDCVRLREVNEAAMATASDRAQRMARRAIWSTALVGISALATGLIFSLLLSTVLVRPLRQFMEAARRVAAGDYDAEVPVRSTDEMGRLADEFNTMVRKLKAYHELNLERFAAETQKSQAIIQAIDDGIVLVDASFIVTAINPAAAQALRVVAEDSIGKHFLEVVKDQGLLQLMRETAAGHASTADQEQNVLTVQHDGKGRHYQFSTMPVRARSRQMIGVVLLLRDITKLKELDQLKSEFVLTASHELRTPLTTVNMAVELLRENAGARLTPKEQELVEAAHEDLQRLRALVNDLLDLSRIEAGKVALEFAQVPVSTLFAGATSVLQPQIDEKSLELSMVVPDELPEVRADANKVTWVLTNLVANAVRYTERGGHVRLTAERVGLQVHVSVSDDGAGIPHEMQARIFDKFVQVGPDQGAQGSGLGLAICKEVVRAHGGTIWVESTPGEGATFTFTLPIAQ